MGRLPAWFGKASQAITRRYSLVGHLVPCTARVSRPGVQLLCPALAFFPDLSFERYEYPLAHSFSSLGWGRDLSAFRSIGETGQAVCGLPSHGLSGGFYFAKSRNILAVDEVHPCFRFRHFFR
jgi:hypothetical protein